MRLAKNEYQKLRDQAATAQQKKTRSERKKRYRLSANERRKQLRQDESEENKAKRPQRRYQEPKYKGTSLVERALVMCRHCSEGAIISESVLRCPMIDGIGQDAVNVVSLIITFSLAKPLNTLPALLIEPTVEPKN
jgi:hypothetical protein